MPDFYYIKGDSFTISDLYLGKLKDSLTGETIGSQAQQSVSMNGDEFPCYRIYPVYKQKTAYTTVGDDETESDGLSFAANTFNFNQTIKTGRLDTIQIRIAANGDYNVKGFDYRYENYNQVSSTSAETERSLESEKLETASARALPYYKKNWNQFGGFLNSDVALPQNLDFTPLGTDNVLYVSGELSNIDMTVNPAANNASDQSKGAAAYTTEDGTVKTAQFDRVDAGLLRGSSIDISPYKVGKPYQFFGAINEEDKYPDKDHILTMQWTDMTGDTNNDGVLSKEEEFALGENAEYIQRNSFSGETFPYVPQLMGRIQLYYQIVPKAINDTGHKNSISGTVKLRTADVISHTNGKFKEIPLEGAHIIAGGKEASTDKDGHWTITSSEFDVNETYPVIAEYGGKNYNGYAMVNKDTQSSNIVIDEYNTFDVVDFEAARVENKSGYLNTEDWKITSINSCAVSNEDKRHLYSFKINELNKGTATVGNVEVYRYDSNGALKDTYTAVYNESTNQYEIKKPSLIGTNNYNYSINPATEKVGAGDYLAIRVYDQNNIGYIEHNVGMVFKPRLSVLTVVNSFKSPFNGVIEFLNKMDTSLDLGFTQKLDDLAESKGDVTTTEDERTISFGWNKKFKKSYDSSKKKDDKDDKGDKKEAPDTPVEEIKESAKKLEGVSTGDNTSEEDEKIKEEAKETASNAVDKNNKDNKKNGKTNADLKFILSVGVSIVMGYDNKANKYYFKDLVVTGVVDGEASATYKYTTPVGITIMVKGELSGDITAMMVTEPFYKNPDKPDYLYMSESDSKIDLSKLGSSDVDRKLSIYGKLMIRPKVTLSAGVSFVKLASLSLSGSADFDMVFTTANAGKGSVTLSSELVLGLIGDKIKKKWLIFKKKYDMFNINGTTMSSLMSDGDYRYDVITEEDVDEQLYLNNRSYSFGEINNVSLAEVSVDHYNEHILETGAFPSAQPLIKVISYGTESDGSDTSMIMLFLDSDTNGTVLKYSICENNVWSQPQLVDNDGADDDTAQIYDLGDRFIITWSSEDPEVDKTDFVTRFNSRNIRAVFFDKALKTFGDIMEVTKTTDGDNCADDSAAVADYTAPDGTRKLIMTYVKSLYEQVNSDELMVGDVVNPYSTIAYRFYDFETNTWTEEYSENDINNLLLAMNSDEVELYTENWYGQGFMDLSKYVDIDDSSMIISEDDNELGHMAGRWSRQPESSEISIKSMSSDPQTVEHKTITCGKYAVSAYVIDLDKETATNDDREIFLQMYDFAQDKFYPLIRLTNDSVIQQNIVLEETPEGVLLYYISDGNIVSFNITDMIARALYKTTANDGTEVLINSNCYSGYTVPYTIVEAEKDNPLTEFTINAADDAVLITWSQNGCSYKDGIDPTSNEAAKAENYYKERQIYTAMETFEDFEEPYYDEDGSVATYPNTDDYGNVIDYNLEPDVDGKFGVVSAGDEMIRHGKILTWTKPVKITEEQGENFTNIDCVIIAPKLLRMVYLKGLSTVKDISGTMMPVEDTDNRSLIVSDFNFGYKLLEGVIVNGNDICAGQENMHIDIDVTNKAIWEMSDITVNLYQQTKDGEKTLIGTEIIDNLIGGNTESVSVAWNVPQSLDGLKLIAEVEQDGLLFSEDDMEYEDDIQIVIDDISHKMLDRNTARLQITVSNNGSENASDENVYVNLNGAETSSESFELLSGDTKVITMDVDVPLDAFEDTSDENKISETAELRVYTQFDIHDYEITRSADKVLAELMNEVKIQNAETGETYTDKISVKQKDIVALNAVSDDNNTLDMKISNYDSENVKVVNNMISPQTKGDTSVSIDVYPYINTYVTNNTDYMAVTDTYVDLPSSLIKTVKLTLNVTDKKTSGGSGGGSSANPTPIAAPTEAPTATEAPLQTPEASADTSLPFTDVKASDWFYDSVKYAYENKLFSGVADTLFAPNESMTRAMLVTVLYRAEGAPDMSEEIWGYPFEDVDAEGWYGAAVYWARNNDIVQGYSDEKFAPNDPITREQIAAILYRYTQFKGISTDEIGDLSQFADAESISDWAQNNVGWAVGKGLLTGKGSGILDPLGNATRVEVAAMLQRFMSNEAEVTKTVDFDKVVSVSEEMASKITAALYDYFGTADAETGNLYVFEIVGEINADNEHYYLGRWQWNVEGHNSLLCDFVLKDTLTEMYDCTIQDNKINWFEADSIIK